MNRNHNQVLSAMQKVCPEISEQISNFWEASLDDYIHSVWNSPIRNHTLIGNQARAAFYNALHSFNVYSGCNISEVINEFEQFPILQTGPHCQLFLNEIDFNAVFFSWLGSKLHDLKYSLILNSATRTLQWSSGVGPGWLNLSTGNVNIFGLSAKKLGKLSVCAPNFNVTYQRDALDAALNSNLSEYERVGLEKMVKQISRDSYQDIVSAFSIPNHNFINMLDSDRSVFPIILNDYFTSEVVAKNINLQDSLINKILFNNSYRNRLIKITEKVKNLPHNRFLKDGTFLFWGIRDNKVRSLKLQCDSLCEVDESSPDALKIYLSHENVLDALRKKQIIPNIFLSFLVLSILPKIRVIGGTRQIGYYPIIKNMLMEILSKEDECERDLLNELKMESLHVWGTNFIKHTEWSTIEILGRSSRGEEMKNIAESYRKKSICEITKNMTMFSNHPTWQHFI